MTPEGGGPAASTMWLPDGRQLSWQEYGDPHGQAVIYFHGMPGSRLEPGLFGKRAATRNLRIIAPDRPGYGGSTPQPRRVVPDFTADISHLLNRLELAQAGFLGFSGGGPYALACGARFPERTRHLTLVSSWAPLAATGTQGMADDLQQLWQLAATDFPTFSDALAAALRAAGSPYQMLVGGAQSVDQEVFADPRIAAVYERNLAEGMHNGLEGMLEDVQALLRDWDVRLVDIHCPVTLWHGDVDGNAPISMGRWLAAQLRHAELTEWPGSGHFEAFRRWDTILDAVAAH